MKTESKIRFMATRIIMTMLIFSLLAMFATSAASAQKVMKGSPVPADAPPPPPPPPLPGQDLPEYETVGNDIIYNRVDVMPEYPGGDAALLNHLVANTKYPASAKSAGIQGKALVKFCVTKTGTVDKISIIRGVSPDIDMEAMRVVSTLSTFKPGKAKGEIVNVWYIVPITFALR